MVFDYDILNDELINKLCNTLNELINRNNLSVKTTELSNELFETLKMIENMGKFNLDGFYKSANKIKKKKIFG